MSDKPWRDVIAVDELEKDWVTRAMGVLEVRVRDGQIQIRL